MPYLIAIGGHTGTGKTTLAYRLKAALPFLKDALIVEGDQVRRKMLGYRLRDVMQPEDYLPEVSTRVQNRLDNQIRSALGEGRSVIDSSGFFQNPSRRHMEALAAEVGAHFVGLWLVAPRTIQEERIRQRMWERAHCKRLASKQGHASDACLGVIDKFGDLGVPRSKVWHVLDASGGVESVLKAACKHMEDL